MFKLAHLSDIHLSPMPRARRRDLLSKRILGYVNWHRGRKLMHQRKMLDALTRNLLAQKPDHIAVTGDLVNLGLPDEFVRAAAWLKELGPPSEVTAIPGNHDAYVRIHPERGTGLWRDYMVANEEGERLVPTGPKGFPFVQRFGDVALIGLSSAIPTAPFIAAGHIGSKQRHALADALQVLGREGLFRVVLIHHPPLPHQAPWRRGLRDDSKFAAILKEHGAELVLHGHNHEESLKTLETVGGPCFVVGVPSASEIDDKGLPAAAYNEYAIQRAGNGWRCEMSVHRPFGELTGDWQVENRLLRES